MLWSYALNSHYRLRRNADVGTHHPGHHRRDDRIRISLPVHPGQQQPVDHRGPGHHLLDGGLALHDPRFDVYLDVQCPTGYAVSTVDPHALNVPRNSCLLTLGTIIVMCLVYVGSSVAFDAILSVGIFSLMGTYGLSTGCVLYRRLR
ncbi:hypothetical protein DHEL01_v212442 [Diaporthe helianthi]|uniref:Uncharacterized protein n=1 Tax=Diaporthe helianthi TaxID=158607 RepID=A0A2P5HFY4_DIAHE|nr:hypothetical protein DHEL01_v212442 [Diaporthe helianthi]